MMAQARAVRARARMVKAQSRLKQDDCGSGQGKGAQGGGSVRAAALAAEAGKPRGRRQQSAAVNWDSGHGGNGSWELQG